MSRAIQITTLLPCIFATLLLFAQCSKCQQLRWPYNLPPHVKYYPEDENIFKREEEVHDKLKQQTPTAVRKLSSDPGEKFYLHYWNFEGDEDQDSLQWGNQTDSCSFEPPLPLHAALGPDVFSWPLLKRLTLNKRDFECPAGSFACNSINRPNSCCTDGSTCQIIQDTGLGDVGCCPSNQICSGSLSQCPAGGYTDCPDNPGGGCCLPNYSCMGIGCVLTRTATIIITRTSTTSNTPPPSPPPSTTNPPPTSPIITSMATTSNLPNVLVCSSGFRSCPASLGGGCCPTDRACGRDVCPEISSTNSFIAPGRPTSNSASPTSNPTLIVSGCPTGFYACSAVYQGGCCQTGRNCDTTSCPVTGSITVVDGTITAVAPTGSGIESVDSLLTGPCATGWSTCPPDVGGGCCPMGYACGTACTATASGGQGSEVGKVAPNSASSVLIAEVVWTVVGSFLFSIAMAQAVFV